VDVEVTNKVIHGFLERDRLVLKRCVCGQEFGWWEMMIPMKDTYLSPVKCPNCKAELFFTTEIKVWTRKEETFTHTDE